MNRPKMLVPGDRVLVVKELDIDDDSKLLKMRVVSAGVFEGYENEEGILLDGLGAQTDFGLTGQMPSPIVRLDNDQGRVTAPPDMIFTDEEVSLIRANSFTRDGYGLIVEFEESKALTGDTWTEHTQLFTTWDPHTAVAEA